MCASPKPWGAGTPRGTRPGGSPQAVDAVRNSARSCAHVLLRPLNGTFLVTAGIRRAVLLWAPDAARVVLQLEAVRTIEVGARLLAASVRSALRACPTLDVVKVWLRDEAVATYSDFALCVRALFVLVAGLVFVLSLGSVAWLTWLHGRLAYGADPDPDAGATSGGALAPSFPVGPCAVHAVSMVLACVVMRVVVRVVRVVRARSDHAGVLDVASLSADEADRAHVVWPLVGSFQSGPVVGVRDARSGRGQ
mmetsp:Transcript_88801/g.246688  ORF Transcript_88801/g.246688 Transcript_88801/m.246688 type:complete len:251 (-) Transcript_88801:215-967(-)